MSDIRTLKCDRRSLLVFSVLISCLTINIFIRAGFDFEYMKLSSGVLINDSESCFNITVLYVLYVRIKQLIFVILLMKILNTETVYNCIIIFLGVVFGAMGTIQTYYSGLVGIGELILYILPHYIFYILLIHLLFRFYKGFYREESRFGRILFLVVIFIGGIVAEAVFSRFFLQNFYQYIVMRGM